MRKDGKSHKLRPNGKPKATITEHRLMLRNLLWSTVKLRLQHHLQVCKLLKVEGEASRIARALGTAPSQIHRWSCPVCEHDNEPTFSIGFALMLYLEDNQRAPKLTRSFQPNHPAMTYIPTRTKPARK